MSSITVTVVPLSKITDVLTGPSPPPRPPPPAIPFPSVPAYHLRNSSTSSSLPLHQRDFSDDDPSMDYSLDTSDNDVNNAFDGHVIRKRKSSEVINDAPIRQGHSIINNG